MSFEPDIWSKLHGASTHFPIALVIVSAFCDAWAWLCPREELQSKLRFAATVTIVLGALGSYAAVFTGLVTARWQIWGHATLLRHHQFVWPAFALISALAAWRVVHYGQPSRREATINLLIMLIAVAVVSLAGYWGGELLSEG
jgi:uncharacterized membrane protein